MTGAPYPTAGRLAPRRQFLSRMGRSIVVGTAMVVATLALGTMCYHLIDGMAWLDAFHQSAMLLAGMGPVKEITTVPGKLFDSLYALLCAFIMLGAAGFVFAPIIHRMLHRFHLEDVRSDP